MSKENVTRNKMVVKMRNNGMSFSDIQRTLFETTGEWMTEEGYRKLYKRYKDKYAIQN